MPVVLDGGAAARGVDDDGIDAVAPVHQLGPGVDVALGEGDRFGLAAHVMHQRAAAAGAGRHLHVDAAPRQQADGGVVDLGAQHLLGAAGEQDDAPLALGLGRGGAGTGEVGAAQQPARRQIEHGDELLEPEPAQETGEGLREACRPQRQAEAFGIGQDGRQQGARQALAEAAAAGLLDVGAGVVDEVHVVDAAGAGGHAGEAGEAAVDVSLHLRARGTVVLEHLLHQVDAAARAVALVAQQHVGRAGGGAEAAVHAAAQDLVDLRRARVFQLLAREARLHGGPVLSLRSLRTCGRD